MEVGKTPCSLEPVGTCKLEMSFNRSAPVRQGATYTSCRCGASCRVCFDLETAACAERARHHLVFSFRIVKHDLGPRARCGQVPPWVLGTAFPHFAVQIGIPRSELFVGKRVLVAETRRLTAKTATVARWPNHSPHHISFDTESPPFQPLNPQKAIFRSRRPRVEKGI